MTEDFAGQPSTTNVGVRARKRKILATLRDLAERLARARNEEEIIEMNYCASAIDFYLDQLGMLK
jgi:hypothetical protein